LFHDPSVTDFKRNYDAVGCVSVSFQLRINNNSETKAIDISFVKQFAVPVFLLVVLIIVLSMLVDREADASHVWGKGIHPSSSEEVGHLQRKIADLEGESQRLKAFAKKMVKLAKLDQKVFSFDEPPARGGLGGRNIFRRDPSVIAAAVSQDIKGLQEQLIQQSNQFERMQLVLRSRALGNSRQRSKWPVVSGYLSSTFGMRKDPFNGRLRKHNGIDLAGPRGSDIMSVAAGTVIFSGRKGGYGRVVEIKHANGMVSRYAHLQESMVTVNQEIVAGEKIALLGTSGRSTGPHLHLEILKNNINIDPLVFLGSPK
jgi:murein DD-endopeptidase MepM/ murein hydrolase activator NlpD